MSNRAFESEYFEIKPRKKKTPPFNLNILKTLNLKFSNFVDSLPNNSKIGKSIRIAKNEENKNINSITLLDNDVNVFSGKISSTTYDGKKTHIRETKNKKNNPDSDPVFTSSETQGPEKTFYFLIYFNKKHKKGMIFTESYDKYGIKEVFRNIIKSFFDSEFVDYRISFRNNIQKEVIKQIVDKGGVSSIQVTEKKISKDIADKLKVPKEELKNYKLVVRIESTKNRLFPKRTSKVLSKVYDSQIITDIFSDELKTLGFNNTSKLSVGYNYENQNKTIIFDNPFSNLRSRYPFEVEIDEFDRSNFEKIDILAKQKLKEICTFFEE